MKRVMAPRERQRPACGAHARSTDRPCLAPVCVRQDGSLAKRCRLHGGLSTGPRTAEGKERSIVALIVGHTEWRRRQREHPVDVLFRSSRRSTDEA